MDFPTQCKRCNQSVYGPVNYCPFCGTASASVTVADNKQKLETLRSEINNILDTREYTPDIRGGTRQKGKEIGITEAAADSLLLAVLKEKGFSPVKDGPNEQLTVEWCTAERKPKEVTPPTQPEPPTTEEPQQKTEKPAEVKPPISTPTERAKEPAPPVPPPPPAKPLFWKVAVVLGAVIIIAGLFYGKKGPFAPSVQRPEQGEIRPRRTVEQPKETRTEVPEPPKQQVEQKVPPQPAATPNLDAERERIRREAEKEALAKIETERQRQEQISRQREIENQRQEQAAKQREIDDYLSDGKRFFNHGKYELCIEKMREVVRRDNNNSEARQYIRMASERINDIRNRFRNPDFGGSE